jgi:hypothetical protein
LSLPPFTADAAAAITVSSHDATAAGFCTPGDTRQDAYVATIPITHDRFRD